MSLLAGIVQAYLEDKCPGYRVRVLKNNDRCFEVYRTGWVLSVSQAIDHVLIVGAVPIDGTNVATYDAADVLSILDDVTRRIQFDKFEWGE